MIFQKRYYFDTTEQVDWVPMTHEVHYAIRDAKAVRGVVTVVVPSPEAGLLVGENIPEVREALIQAVVRWVGELPAASSQGKDAKQRPANIAARVQSALLGRSLTLSFDQHKLTLDPYSEVILIDFEPKRQRREVLITVSGEEAAEAPT